MKYFKDELNGIWAFEEDGSQDEFIGANLVAITLEEADAIRFPVLPPVVPTIVSMRQARLALFEQGVLGSVQTAIDGMVDPAKTITQISWDYATEVHRDDDLVVQLSAALGLDNAALDALFTLAASL